MASPVDPLASLQCHCIIFNSISDPTPCTLSGSQNLNWETAQSFASVHDLKIRFASQRTVSKVLEVEKPLPTSVLLSISDAEERDSVGSTIVCGTGNEVRRKYLRAYDVELGAKEQELFASKVVAVLLLFIILYAAGEYVWIRYFDKGGRIKLRGGEKDLAAHTRQKERSSPEPLHDR